ncbi:hypothetical+protein [Methylocapsa aurea]
MRHNPAAGAIVIMLRSLKMHGMAQAVSELTEQGSPAFEAALPADSDEAGHAFQYESGHLFRSEAGQRSDLMSATGVVRAQIDLDDVSRRGRGQACSRFAGAERRLRRLSPESSSR